MPVAAWLRGALRPLTRDLLSSEAIERAGLFDPKGVARLLVEHEAGIRDHRKPIWTLLVFELWRRALFDGINQSR
jgi:asparagine synthase (glutamine-hydrolysing)